MDGMSIALSGLRAASTGLAVRADNVANQRTEGFQARRVDLATTEGGGVQVQGTPRDSGPAVPGSSNVDLAVETVGGMGFDLMYRANLQVVKTEDELLRTTLDLKA